MRGKVLVAGASGLVGLAAARAFAADGYDVVAVSRRPPRALEAHWLAVDLADAEACRAAFASLRDVTHVVYAALQEAPGLFAGWVAPELIERNGAMLRNLFQPLLGAARGLRHVSLLHGTKAYGLHHHAVGRAGWRMPLVERTPRRPHPNFYFLQEEYLRERQAGAEWGMTVFRPTVIYGDALGANLNPIPPLAAYAALLREAGEPLSFPGARGGEAIVREGVSAEVVAGALTWAAEAKAARGETFNLTNGDVFTWETVWPAIAAAFEMPAGPPRPLSLAEELPRRREEWAALVDRYGLAAPRDVVEFCGANSLVYADAMLGPGAGAPVPFLNSTIKVRKAGYDGCEDSEEMFARLFRRLREERLVP